jgi:hypothetical protein
MGLRWGATLLCCAVIRRKNKEPHCHRERSRTISLSLRCSTRPCSEILAAGQDDNGASVERTAPLLLRGAAVRSLPPVRMTLTFSVVHCPFGVLQRDSAHTSKNIVMVSGANHLTDSAVKCSKAFPCQTNEIHCHGE